MRAERLSILKMLAEGKVTPEEAERLLQALGKEPAPGAPPEESPGEAKPKPKYLRVLVGGKGGEGAERVNIRVPIKVLRAGIQLGALLPGDAHGRISKVLRERGIRFDLNDLAGAPVDELVEALAELSVDIDSGEETVRVFCE